MKTSEKIKEIIKKSGKVSPKDIYESLDINKRAVFKQLKNLLENGEVSKIGKPPHVFYQLKDKERTEPEPILDKKTANFIEKNFLNITPSGQINGGISGFAAWCRERGFDVAKMAPKYIETIGHYNSLRKNGLLDATKKLKDTFPQTVISKVFYHDFYSIEIFGKTKIGQLLLYAKISQNKNLAKEVTDLVKPEVERLVRKYKIDGVIFVPPTVKREVQFMNQFEKNLNLSIRKINVLKVKSQVTVSQKTLSSLKDRIINARETFIVEARGRFKNVLIIDDAVGSGATMNEIAAKLKNLDVVEGKIFGYAVTGSIKGFDVISEV